ncbi:MAG: pyridoxamine 5'-phosphate oxidase family protein [Acidobacteriota bacterium]
MTSPASNGPLHAGELAIQRRYGVAEMGGRVAAMIRPEIAPTARDFLARQPFATAAVLDRESRPWAALWSGSAGFLNAVDEKTVRIAFSALDALTKTRVDWPGPVGLLALEPATRRRMRLNGRAAIGADGVLELHADEVYGNCPKYIQKRHLEPVNETPGETRFGEGPDERQWRWIKSADTFFLATHNPDGGADASHRGGSPGFVKRRGDRIFEFADYAGNNLFNSLGNLAVNPRLGVTFIDFPTGDVLQLTGHAELIDRAPDADDFAGSEGRIIRVEVEEWAEQAGAMPWRGEVTEPSPFNP